MWLLAALAVVLTDVVLGISQCGIQFVEYEILMVCNQSRSLKEKERCAADGEGLIFKSEEKSIELKCQDRPLFGLETLFEGKEINLTLHTDYAPKMVWIEGKADGGSSILIIGIVVGCVALIIVISLIVVIVICRHRLSEIFSKPKPPTTEYSPISQSPTTESEQLRPCQNSSNQEIYAELEDVYDKPQTSPSSPARPVAFVPPPLPSLPPPPSSPTEMAPAKAQTSPSSPARSVTFVPPPLPSLPPPPSSPTEMAPAKSQTSPSSPAWSVSFVPPPLPSLPPPPSSPTDEAAPAKPPRGKPSSFKRPEKRSMTALT
ncbi:hypothetical protein C0Q70_11817 [Pomacea canaliculata]|uniref:Uncharacterized protein n=1 Tax=Pomacea canaliculata TaxID=400727 RepID=A0A2T7P721_POMCA|nr:hypothetical protein C0Q70_11817 [Pomacea canaliculata]